MFPITHLLKQSGLYCWRASPGKAVIRAILSLFLLVTSLVSLAAAAPPNIVVILGDDVGWGDVQANNPVSRVPTPNLNQLARDGMRFTNAHTSAAVCAPSRYSALTGNYQWRGRRPWGTWEFQEASQILTGQKTVADLLSSKSYSTAFIGKMHLGGDFYAKGSNSITRTESSVDFARPFRNGPLAHGFGYSFALLEGIQDPPYAYFEDDDLYGDPALLRTWLSGKYGKSVIPNTGLGMPYYDSSKVGPDLMTRALAFIDEHKATYGSTKPFFLYYSSQSVHYPYTPPDQFFGQPVRGVSGLCARQDMVVELDVAVGTLIAKLRTEGLLENTLIVFTSDNGGSPDNCGHDASGPDFSGYKGLVQEGGHRVPFIVRWGDGTNFQVPRGAVRNQLLGVQDLTATLATLAGASIGATQAKDSFNMLPVWLGTRTDADPVRDHLIAEARKSSKKVSIPPTFAYYEGKWKLVVRRSTSTPVALALFDIEADKAETRDLLASQGPLATAMLARFNSRYNGPRSAPELP